MIHRQLYHHLRLPSLRRHLMEDTLVVDYRSLKGEAQRPLYCMKPLHTAGAVKETYYYRGLEYLRTGNPDNK